MLTDSLGRDRGDAINFLNQGGRLDAPRSNLGTATLGTKPVLQALGQHLIVAVNLPGAPVVPARRFVKP